MVTDEAWLKEQTLDIFTDVLLKSALTIAVELLMNANDEDEPGRQWVQRIYIERPDIVQSVFEDIARVELKFRKEHTNVLHIAANCEHTKYWRGKFALKLLSDFPSAKTVCLRYMLSAALSDLECHNELTELAKTTVNTHGCVKGEQRAIWLTTGFVLAYNEFQPLLVKYARSRNWVIWTVIDTIEQLSTYKDDRSIILTIPQLECLIRIFGEKFKNFFYPSGGWSGGQNPWDASEFIKQKINVLSVNPMKDASDALMRLLKNNKLASYHDYIKHAIVNQAKISREAEYVQPTWEKTTETLRGEKPANIADLHALILDHLEGLKKEVRYSNTSKFRPFWRCAKNGVVDKPQIENTCRDRLIDLLGYRLSSLGLHLEPEGSMAADRRADIVIFSESRQKLPLELKRDSHSDLWKACENQLDRFYTRDPAAEGYGIYVVFWFGDKRTGLIPKPPNGIKHPKSAEDLEIALRSLIPSDKHHCLEAVVIDVTQPM